jgi:hypothetical protein
LVKHCSSKLAVALLLICCGESVTGQNFRALNQSRTGISFANTFQSPDSVDINGFIYLWNGGGVAIGDLNNDGLSDVVFSGNTAGNRVFLNEGELRFKDATAQLNLPLNDSAWNTGVVLADVNGDGWLDIYICRSQLAFRTGPNLLYINQKGSGFKEMGRDFGLDITDNCTQASFFDADKDGDLDVYLITYPKNGAQYSVYQSSYAHGMDRLLYNDNGYYSESQDSQTLLKDHGFGLGVVTADFDKNGEIDIYVANDLLSVDRYYIQRDGQFSETLSNSFGHVSFNSMGADAGDVNNDGWLDIITLDMLPDDPKRRHSQTFLSNDHQQIIEKGGLFQQYVRNMLHLNSSDNYFKEVGELYGIAASDWSWGPLLFDADNNGKLDLLVTNSLKKDFLNKDLSMFMLDSLTRYNKPEQKSRVYKALVENLTEFRLQNKFFVNTGELFQDMSSKLYGGKKVNTTGAAVGDLDNDGDIDIVFNNLDTTSFILENLWNDSVTSNHFIRLKLGADDMNTHALNAKVTIYSGTEKRLFETVNARGFQSCSEDMVHIGFEENATPDSIMISWPNGTISTIVKPQIDQVITALQPEKSSGNGLPKTKTSLFKEENHLILPKAIHQENFQNDFKSDPILHRQLSRTGPGIAIADVNGDGLMDFYQCAAKGSKGMMYWADSEGKYSPAPLQPWETEIAFEESSALLVDVDGDNDNDLIIIGSGYELSGASPWYRDRLYLNDGNGFFSSSDGLPSILQSKSCAATADFDKDGDLDLFVGGRYGVEGYPTSPDSYLLVNDGKGHFSDKTADLAPGFTALGMVSSAIWTDQDNDGDSDLFLVGEWMQPTLFENLGGRLSLFNVQFDSQAISGWWNSISGADLDNDGDIDYVLGNYGENSTVKASEESPATLYYPKLNVDSRPDPILSFFVSGKETLFAKRDKMLDQILPLRKRFIDYGSYANTTPRSIVGENAPTLQADNFKSVVLLNNGASGFTVIPLPLEAQAFPVFGIHLVDLDDDPFIDLVLTGNCFYMSNEIGNLDAGGILALKGDGNGHFSTFSSEGLGIIIKSDAKALGFLGLYADQYRWLVTSNNGVTKLIAAIKPTNVSAIESIDGYICLQDGKRRKTERYIGSGFWTQNATISTIPSGADRCR